MRWRAPSERLQMVFAAPLIAVLAVPSAIAVALTWASDNFLRFAFPAHGWRPWFAWRPVRCNDWFDHCHYGMWFWLERVERRRGCPGQVSYRAAQGTEAQRAETGTGSVHDGPVAESDAPKGGQ